MNALGEAGRPPSVAKARLLVVEDDAIVAGDVKSSLGEMGYGVADVIRRGEWALNAVREEEPDLVLMDIRLAGSMDGVDAGEAILEETDVPVVYLTAYADDETRSRVRETSPFGYVVKPFTERDLQSAIEVALLRHRMERELASERSRLAKRVDEQSCLYDVSRILQDVGSDFEERLSRVVERLPGGWQHSDVAAVRLSLDGATFRSEGYAPGEPSLSAAIEVDGERAGEIDVRYLEERPEEDVGPFLTEEKRLLEEVADRVGAEASRRRVRNESERQRRRLSRILETAADGILLTDAEGRFEYANPAAEEILGLERSEIGGRTYRDPDWKIRGPDGGPFPEERLPVAQVLRNEESVREVEHSVVRSDGSRIVLRVNANPLLDAGGELTGVVASIRDVTEQRRFEAQLEQRALHDYLTRLPNRALFRNRLDHALERSERTGVRLAVLFIDLKRFKVVNDSLGHEAGDRVLREISRRLEGAVRGEDTVARIGGDEFTVLLEEVDGEEGALRVAKRLAAVFEKPVSVGGQDVTMEASIGIALHEGGGESGVEGTDLLARADAAMYRAKEMPGTRYQVADPSRETSRPDRLERESRLRRALADGRLHTAYQPIFSVETGEVLGVEALARWEDPEAGDVAPDRFIPLAEETGVIVELGEDQLRRACRETPEGRAAGRGDEKAPRLHANLSARQLEDPGVVERILGILEETGFQASRLCLEITESAALREAETVAALKERDVKLAIDDFGTQYSTLSQFRKLQTDALKIDRTFVAGLPESDEDRAIVETVLTLGRSLGVEVVAEGIETEDQLQTLRELGCHAAQGYHLARPMPPEELRDLLRGEGGA